MRQIGVRALKQNASAVVTQVAAGEVVTVTDRGRPVAQIVPLSVTRLQGLIVSGQARPARRSFASLREPPAKRGGLSSTLAKSREQERY